MAHIIRVVASAAQPFIDANPPEGANFFNDLPRHVACIRAEIAFDASEDILASVLMTPGHRSRSLSWPSLIPEFPAAPFGSVLADRFSEMPDNGLANPDPKRQLGGAGDIGLGSTVAIFLMLSGTTTRLTVRDLRWSAAQIWHEPTSEHALMGSKIAEEFLRSPSIMVKPAARYTALRI